MDSQAGANDSECGSRDISFLNIQKLEAGRLTVLGKHGIYNKSFFWEKKKTKKIFKLYFYVYKCVRVESPVTRVTCSCEPCDVVLKSKCS